MGYRGIERRRRCLQTKSTCSCCCICAPIRSRCSSAFTKRALQENRLDDANPDFVRRRFQEYEAETAPILDFYPAAKIRTVDAGAAPLEVLRQIIEVLQIMLFPEALQHAA